MIMMMTMMMVLDDMHDMMMLIAQPKVGVGIARSLWSIDLPISIE
jgi:hypothetical protein